MNLDDKIKQELESEALQLDKILAHDSGIFTMLAHAYKGALGGWMILVTVITLLVTVILFWAAYQFFFVESLPTHKLHWGIILLLACMVQIALKLWTFMEMNRQSTIREVKRLEIAIAKLTSKLA